MNGGWLHDLFKLATSIRLAASESGESAQQIEKAVQDVVKAYIERGELYETNIFFNCSSLTFKHTQNSIMPES